MLMCHRSIFLTQSVAATPASQEQEEPRRGSAGLVVLAMSYRYKRYDTLVLFFTSKDIIIAVFLATLFSTLDHI